MKLPTAPRSNPEDYVWEMIDDDGDGFPIPIIKRITPYREDELETIRDYNYQFIEVCPMTKPTGKNFNLNPFI